MTLDHADTAPRQPRVHTEYAHLALPLFRSPVRVQAIGPH